MKDKYKYQVKDVCMKCETARSFYSPGEKGKVYLLICKDCKKILAKLVKRLSKPYYWTKEGYL